MSTESVHCVWLRVAYLVLKEENIIVGNVNLHLCWKMVSVDVPSQNRRSTTEDIVHHVELKVVLHVRLTIHGSV